MRRLLLLAAAGTLAVQSPAAYPGPESLASELHRLAGAIHDGGGPEAVATLPNSWEIETPGRRYSISTAPLRDPATSPEQAERWLAHLAGELESSSTPAAHLASARSRLDRILTRREFAPERQPTVLELLWQRFTTWLKNLLGRLFGPVFGNPVTGRAIFWVLALTTAGFLLTWLWRWYDGRKRIPPAPGEPPIPSLRASEWLQTARDAADRGDLRAAIHSAYWAAVTHLQSAHLLPEDFTRTPREYLGSVAPAAPFRAPLAALTSGLEHFWYADRPVQKRDFEDALHFLEALGCRAD